MNKEKIKEGIIDSLNETLYNIESSNEKYEKQNKILSVQENELDKLEQKIIKNFNNLEKEKEVNKKESKNIDKQLKSIKEKIDNTKKEKIQVFNKIISEEEKEEKKELAKNLFKELISKVDNDAIKSKNALNKEIKSIRKIIFDKE